MLWISVDGSFVLLHTIFRSCQVNERSSSHLSIEASLSERWCSAGELKASLNIFTRSQHWARLSAAFGEY